MKKTTRQRFLLLQIFLCIIMGLYIYVKTSNKMNCVDCSDVGIPVMAKWSPASEKFLLDTPIELRLSLINTSDVNCAVCYYKFDMEQIDFPSCKVNSKLCKRILEPKVGSWDGSMPSIALEAGEAEGIPLYLNNYWLLNQTGSYQVTCVINLDVSLWSRDKNYNFEKLSATNNIIFEIENSTTNEIINCLNEYLVDNGSFVFVTAKGVEAIASLKSPIAIEYLKKGVKSRYLNSGYWVSKGLIDINSPEADTALVWSLTNGTRSAKVSIIQRMGNEKYFIPEALPIIKEIALSSNSWMRNAAWSYIDALHEEENKSKIKEDEF